MRRAALALAVARIHRVRLSGRRVGLAVMHHRVAPVAGDHHAEFVPAVSTAALDAQLTFLRRHFRLVRAGDLLDAVRTRGPRARIPLAVTFDDDTACHLEHAAPLLRAHSAPATFFLNGMGLDAPHPYWWEWLQAARDRGASWDDLLPAAARAQLGADPAAWEVSLVVEALAPADRAALAETWQARAGSLREAGLRAADIAALAEQGFETGFHGAHHEPMSLVDDATLAAELSRGPAFTETTVIAYPHGKADARVADAARARGFTAGFTVEPRAVTPNDDPLLLGRVDGATEDLAAFAWSLAAALAGGSRR